MSDHHLKFGLLEKRHHISFTDDLEIHFLELPKFRKSADELVNDLDIWLYFLRHAEKMDPEALPDRLRTPIILRAVEELKMLTQNDIERERYEARRKAQLDYNTDIKVARLEGEKLGREQGEKLGLIHAYEEMLNRTPTPKSQLLLLSPEELTHLVEELHAMARPGITVEQPPPGNYAMALRWRPASS